VTAAAKPSASLRTMPPPRTANRRAQIARVPGLLGDRIERSENALIADGVLA